MNLLQNQINMGQQLQHNLYDTTTTTIIRARPSSSSNVTTTETLTQIMLRTCRMLCADKKVVARRVKAQTSHFSRFLQKKQLQRDDYITIKLTIINN